MLSAVELKKGFLMSFEGSFKPLMWALRGIGSLSTTPAVFLDIRLDLGFSELERDVAPTEQLFPVCKHI